MKLKSLRVKNFHSIGDISLSLPEKGIVVIDGTNLMTDGGSNGCGKSSLISAIPFCIYGRSIKGLTLADCVRSGQSDLLVDLIFQIKDKEIRIVRTTQELKVYENGKLKSGGKKALQEYLINLIGLSFSAFKSLFLGQEWVSFIELTPSERVNALSDVFGVFYLDSILKQIKQKYKKTEEKISNYQVSISHIKGQIQENLNSYQDKIDLWENKRKATLLAKYRQLKELEAEWQELKKLYDEYEQKSKEVSTDSLESEISELENKISIIVSQIQEKNYKMLDLKKENEYLAKELKKLDERRKLFDKGVCPTCGQEIRDKDTFFGHITSEMKKIKKKIFDNEEQIKVCKDFINLKEEERKELEAKRNLFLKQQKDLITIESKVLSLQREKERLLNQIRKIKEDIEELKAEENPYKKLEEERKERLNKLTKELNKYSNLLKQLEDLKVYLEVWSDVIKKTRHELFLLMLKELESRINGFIGFFSLDFRIKFVLEKEKLDMQIERKGELFPFKILSGGELQLTKLSCLLGLYEMVKVRIGDSIKWVVFDEPLAGLDKNKRSKFFELLEILSQSHLVLLIDHHQDIGDSYDMLIFLEKKDGITKLSYIKSN